MVTSIVLAGGKSFRMGGCKAMEILHGRSLLECVIEQLKPLSSRVLIVTSQNQANLLHTSEAEVVVDVYSGKGPLAGIYTGLLTACDMPFLKVELMRYMLELSQGFDAVIPRLGEGKIEPLHAVYSRSCLNIIRTELEHNRLKISYMLDNLCVRYIERVECQRFDPQLLTFFNINSLSDMEQATAITPDR
jgi:molybdopterin-guanine dinucleotide biosynthesis protein A